MTAIYTRTPRKQAKLCHKGQRSRSAPPAGRRGASLRGDCGARAGRACRAALLTVGARGRLAPRRGHPDLWRLRCPLQRGSGGDHAGLVSWPWGSPVALGGRWLGVRADTPPFTCTGLRARPRTAPHRVTCELLTVVIAGPQRSVPPKFPGQTLAPQTGTGSL